MLKYILPIVIIGCSNSNECDSMDKIHNNIIDSLTESLEFHNRRILNWTNQIYYDKVFYEAESNVIKLGSEYKAHIGIESIAHIASNRRFVVLDSGDAQIAGDTLWQNKEGRYKLKFTPTKKGCYTIKGRFIMLGKQTFIESFRTNFIVE